MSSLDGIHRNSSNYLNVFDIKASTLLSLEILYLFFSICKSSTSLKTELISLQFCETSFTRYFYVFLLNPPSPVSLRESLSGVQNCRLYLSVSLGGGSLYFHYICWNHSCFLAFVLLSPAPSLSCFLLILPVRRKGLTQRRIFYQAFFK